jgi:AraC-like DNA-binding protein
MQEGDLFVVGNAYFHGISAFRSPRAKEVLLYFLPEVILGEEASVDGIEYLAPFLYQDTAFPHVIPSRTGVPSEIYKLMMRIHAELPAQSAQARAYVKAYLRMILVLLGDYYRSHHGFTRVLVDRERSIDRIKPVFDYMDSHYTERIDVDTAAGMLNMSRSHFMRFFRTVTGESFVNYLNRFRSAKAEVLLPSSNKSIAEIAQEVGFCDQSYFSKVFQKFVHTQPRAYRRRLLNAAKR